MGWFSELFRRKPGAGPAAAREPAPFAVETADDLNDHVLYIVAYAPADFPEDDFGGDDQAMKLEHAFAELREGVLAAFPGDGFADKRRRLYDALDRSLDAYRAGDQRCGVIILHTEFQAELGEPH